MEGEKRNKVAAAIFIASCLGGMYGMHDDWTMLVMVIPFGWLIIGYLLGVLINGKKQTLESAMASVICTLLLLNVALIYFHRDTNFLIGRFIFVTGAVVMLIRASGDGSSKK